MTLDDGRFVRDLAPEIIVNALSRQSGDRGAQWWDSVREWAVIQAQAASEDGDTDLASRWYAVVQEVTQLARIPPSEAHFIGSEIRLGLLLLSRGCKLSVNSSDLAATALAYIHDHLAGPSPDEARSFAERWDDLDERPCLSVEDIARWRTVKNLLSPFLTYQPHPTELAEWEEVVPQLP